MEMTAPRISAIANDFLTLFVSPAPNFCAVMIANPFASPNKNPTIKLLIVVVAPTTVLQENFQQFLYLQGCM